MRARSLLFCTLVGFASVGCRSSACPTVATANVPTPSHPVDVDRAQLMDADRAFARATAERGVEGWLEFFADDGAQIVDKKGLVQGKTSIRALMSDLLSNRDLRLEWAPDRADASGDLGWTIGRARLLHREADGSWNVRANLQYLTVWRRQPDGRWKVALDIGNQGPAQGPPP